MYGFLSSVTLGYFYGLVITLTVVGNFLYFKCIVPQLRHEMSDAQDKKHFMSMVYLGVFITLAILAMCIWRTFATQTNALALVVGFTACFMHVSIRFSRRGDELIAKYQAFKTSLQ